MNRSTKHPIALFVLGTGLMVWSMGCGEQAGEVDPVAPNGTTGAPDATGTPEDPRTPNGSGDPDSMNRPDPVEPEEGIPTESAPY